MTNDATYRARGELFKSGDARYARRHDCHIMPHMTTIRALGVDSAGNVIPGPALVGVHYHPCCPVMHGSGRP